MVDLCDYAGRPVAFIFGQLEQEHTPGKCQQDAVLQKAQIPGSWQCARLSMVWDTTGAAEVNADSSGRRNTVFVDR
jgi:hypothetical protein